MYHIKYLTFGLVISLTFFSCKQSQDAAATQPKADTSPESDINMYAEVPLTADISHLSTSEKGILAVLFEVADIMDEIYWIESYGNKDTLLSKIQDDQKKAFAMINYGPWDRLNDNIPFIDQVGEKPKGANFYPTDMSKEEFDALADKNKSSQYTMIRRDSLGKLKVIWYHDFFADKVKKASELLMKASSMAEDKGLKNYLAMRAKAFLNDNYQPSDLAWMDMKKSKLDFVVGPIENYEDALNGYKAAHEAYILVKDIEWSGKLAYYAQFLPKMQQEMPVDAKYKKEKPGQDVDLNAYDVVYYAGDCNAGGKTIAINLPNDEEVQLKKGSRKLQLKNAMKAKFETIVVPLADKMISETQRKFISFDAFFANTMFHEVAHGLGIKNTVDGKQTVRSALKEYYSALEEGKADILGLYIITKLHDMGEMKDQDLMTNYVTFLASTFRSIRFGASSAHGKANMIHFNYFADRGAFVRGEDGMYAVDFEKMKKAANELTNAILVLQGDGDYAGAKKMEAELAVVRAELKQDLSRLEGTKIPKDIFFSQGPKILGL